MSELWRERFNQVAETMKGHPEVMIRQALYEVLRVDAPDFANAEKFLNNAAKLIAEGYDYRL